MKIEKKHGGRAKAYILYIINIITGKTRIHYCPDEIKSLLMQRISFYTDK